jgi:hypothetical protein
LISCRGFSFVVKDCGGFTHATRHTQACTDRGDRVESASHRAREGMDMLYAALHVHLLIHPWVLLIVFAGPHVGAVPRRRNDVVAHFEMIEHADRGVISLSFQIPVGPPQYHVCNRNYYNYSPPPHSIRIPFGSDLLQSHAPPARKNPRERIVRHGQIEGR